MQSSFVSMGDSYRPAATNAVLNNQIFVEEFPDWEKSPPPKKQNKTPHIWLNK